jgi:hypothetical protein
VHREVNSGGQSSLVNTVKAQFVSKEWQAVILIDFRWLDHPKRKVIPLPKAK